MGRDALASMEARLRWFHAHGDPGRLLDEKAEAEARELAGTLDSDPGFRSHFALGLFHWYRSRVRSGRDTPRERARAEELLLPCYGVGRPDLPAPLVPVLAERSLRLLTDRLDETFAGSAGPPPSVLVSAWARSLREAPSGPREEIIARVLPTGGTYGPEQVDLLVDVGRAIVSVTPPEHGDRARRLDALANALFGRFLSEDAEADLKAAYEASRTAQQITPAGHPTPPDVTSRRRMMARLHLRRTARSQELDAVVKDAHRALADAEEADRRTCLHALATALDSRYRRTGSAADLQGAADAFDELVRSTPAGYPRELRVAEISDLAEAVSELYRLHRRSTDLDKSIHLLTLLLHTTDEAGPLHSEVVHSLAGMLTTRFETTGTREDIDAAVALLETTRRRLPDGAPQVAEVLLLHGRVLELREERLSEPADLDSAIGRYRWASAVPGPDPTVRLNALAHLGSALRKRSQKSGSESDIDASVAACRQSVDEAPPGHPLLASLQTNLAASHNARYRLTGSVTDLDTEIEINRLLKGSARPEDPEYPLYFLRLGHALAFRFHVTDEAANVHEAIDVLRTGLELADDDSPHVAMLEHALRDAYRLRSQVTRDWRDMEAAAAATKAQPYVPASAGLPQRENIGYFMDEHGVVRLENNRWNGGLLPILVKVRETLAAIPTTSPEWPYAQQLKKVLSEPPETLGGLPGVQKAVDDYSAALVPIPVRQTAGGRLDFDAFLEELRAQFDNPDTQPYAELRVHTAIDMQETLLQDLKSGGHRYSHLALACARLALYEHSGRLPELDTALRAVRSAMAATPPGHHEQAAHHWFLADALRERYERAGEPEDLKGAITALRQLARMLPTTGQGPARLYFNLACAHRLAFERWRDERDRAEVLRSLEQAQACLTAEDPDHELYRALCVWWSHGGPDPAGPLGPLDDLIAACRAVLRALPGHDADRVACQSSLGELLRLRHARTGDRRSLDEAVEVSRRVVEATAVPRAARATDLTRLAALLHHRHRTDGDDSDRTAAIDAYVRASAYPTAAPTARIHAARAAADILAPDDPGEAARVLGTAVRLLPETAPRQQTRDVQQRALSAFPGLVADAVALTLAGGEVEGLDPAPLRALTLLEAGRAVLIGQALEVRGDVALLQQHHPALARHLVDIRSALHLPDGDWEGEEETAGGSPALASPHSRHPAEELTTLLQEIRRQPGFASFAMPPTLESLTAQAAQGPIVVHNISTYRSDALIITEGGVTNLELPALDPQAVRSQLRAFQRALRHTADARLDPVQRQGAQDRLRAGLAWLWDNATGPVLHHLGIDTTHRTSTPWPRVWWVPGGLLGQLPLHAAGHHDDSPDAVDRRTVMDRVVSSFSPSLRALDFSRARSRNHHRRPDKALVVAMPTTPGLDAPLDCAGREADLLKALLPASLHLSAPTSAQVMTHVADYPIVHFACHALCHPTDPSHSTLLLADHEGAPMTVRRLNTLHLQQGQLAYLSACSTAATAADPLLDEAIHLTSAFQLAGFPHVIGTLWQVNDAAALRVATAFYGHLVETEAGPDDAALALHRTLRSLRDQYPRLVSTWAAHLHTGA
ncbi:CHAT domain-containing protein [Streptomyces cinerochromogenes]|uniref:CHAT domain-containing protein n=1 Tax=Streptomyces cinerochromogenes TaxID=66422 RepID=UPI001670783C|nr:CHAT domain-containing protein [Streptomyces cinerochromogenes]GGS80917.1 hypothetical protein GCM10010206_49390 [Streptomyces cinerochromogenes]